MGLQLDEKEVERFARIRTLAQMQALDPVTFEHFVGWLYQEAGYSVATTAVSGDEGIDLVLTRWHKTIIVQCKRYQGNVGQSVVRDLYGALNHTGAAEAHLVTSGTISRQAENWAAGKPLTLIDGHALATWVKENGRATAPPRRWKALLWLALFLLLAGLLLNAFSMAQSVWQGRIGLPPTITPTSTATLIPPTVTAVPPTNIPPPPLISTSPPDMLATPAVTLIPVTLPPQTRPPRNTPPPMQTLQPKPTSSTGDQ